MIEIPHMSSAVELGNDAGITFTKDREAFNDTKHNDAEEKDGNDDNEDDIIIN